MSENSKTMEKNGKSSQIIMLKKRLLSWTDLQL